MMPKQKPYMSKEEYERRTKVLDSNTTGLIHLDKHIYSPMYGFKDEQEYYKAGTVAGRLDKIKVPTFHLIGKDDPPCTNLVTPYEEVRTKTTHLLVGTTEKGAHACHITGILAIK